MPCLAVPAVLDVLKRVLEVGLLFRLEGEREGEKVGERERKWDRNVDRKEKRWGAPTVGG